MKWHFYRKPVQTRTIPAIAHQIQSITQRLNDSVMYSSGHDATINNLFHSRLYSRATMVAFTLNTWMQEQCRPFRVRHA